MEAVKFVPLGDQAVLAYLLDEAAAVELAIGIRTANPPWLHDVVPAYASVGVFFDADTIGVSEVMEWLKSAVSGEPRPSGRGWTLHPLPDGRGSPKQFVIPICYEFAPDMPRVCEHTGLSADEVIARHTAAEFTVYAIGFVPGFPYMGYLPAELCGVPRLDSPRVRVEPGSVGITGRQTAIYPQASPGGWNLIGRTPLTIVDVASEYFPLAVGDRVRSTRIDEAEFRKREGERLSADT